MAVAWIERSFPRASKPPRDPAWRGRVTIAIVGVAIVFPLLQAAEFRPWLLFERDSLEAARRFVGNLFPPAASRAFLATAATATWQTIAIATAGMTVALVIAIPAACAMTGILSVSALGTTMARAPAFVRVATRFAMVLLRSVPELVFALFFVRLFGLGPTAGVLAIGLSYSGMLAKVFAEILESNDDSPTRALLANGASRMQALLYGAIPQCSRELVSYGVYRWECAVRGSVMMGFVGAGGLGQQIDTSMKMFEGGETATLLAIFVALVLVADGVSRAARRATWMTGSRTAVAIVPGVRIGGILLLLAIVALVIGSFASLGVTIAPLFAPEATGLALDFIRGFTPPDLHPVFLRRLANAALETVAMSAVGTLLAALFGLALAVPASARRGPAATIVRRIARPILAILRAIPELVWAALFVIVAGLGPMSGTLALALHTTGVLGRLFAETIENLPAGPVENLEAAGVDRATAFAYATLPQALPQFVSYSLYRWENNIRAATVLGVVGGRGLGQMLIYHLSLFQMQRAASIVVAIVVLVALVDGLSGMLRRRV